MGQRAIHPSEQEKRNLQHGRQMLKKVREDRLNTVKTEYVEFGIVPRLYYSKGQTGVSFDSLSYAVTNNLLAKYVDEDKNINNLKKIEGMLTLYYAQKLIRFLLTDVDSIQNGVIPKTEDEIALQKSMEPYEKEIVVTITPTCTPNTYEHFVKYILSIIQKHKDNIKKYFDGMSDKNKKVALALNLKLTKLYKEIEKGKFDILPLSDVATRKKSNVGVGV